MFNPVFRKLAFRNLKANIRMELPYIIASMIMGMLFYIMSSLIGNRFVQERSAQLPGIIAFGTFIVALFTAIFMFYGNRILIKTRKKEFGLYGVLGLEKHHVASVLGIEQVIHFLIISAMSVVGGQVFGQLAFLGLGKLLKQMPSKASEYHFAWSNVVLTIAVIAIIMFILYLYNLKQINLAKPIELIGQEAAAEKEPKSRWFSLLSGSVLLGAGYYIALSIEGKLNAMIYFFLAALLVAAGSYLLFSSLSIIVLKGLRKNKRVYYKDTNFLSISGMLYRMKANAVGLASICIMLTGTIVTVTTSTAIYNSIFNVINTSMPYDYATTSLYLPADASLEEKETLLTKLTNIVESAEDKENPIKKLDVSAYIGTVAYQDGDRLLSLTSQGKELNPNNARILQVMTLDDFNRIAGKKLQLDTDEVYFYTNVAVLNKQTQIVLADKAYKATYIAGQTIGDNIAVDAYVVIVKNYNTLQKFAKTYLTKNMDTQEYIPSPINIDASWNVTKPSQAYQEKFQKALKENDLQLGIRSKENFARDVYALNGGFVFLGILVGIVFLVGTILITYYKQIAEGMEDRRNYQIMQQVGLPDELIKRTANKQIVWMFFLPLTVAVIHTIVASKIIYQLLSLFGARELTNYLTILAAVVAVIVVIYLIVFKLTSRLYYRIVK